MSSLSRTPLENSEISYGSCDGVLPDYVQTLRIKDANGQVKELVFPKALDLDRPKRARTTFNAGQLTSLEKEFQRNQYLVGKERAALANRLGLSETQVKVWYQNRRTKHKRDRERKTESSLLKMAPKSFIPPIVPSVVSQVHENNFPIFYSTNFNSPSDLGASRVHHSVVFPVLSSGRVAAAGHGPRKDELPVNIKMETPKNNKEKINERQDKLSNSAECRTRSYASESHLKKSEVIVLDSATPSSFPDVGFSYTNFLEPQVDKIQSQEVLNPLENSMSAQYIPVVHSCGNLTSKSAFLPYMPARQSFGPQWSLTQGWVQKI